jgi:AraC-like DNA-binding protein
MSLYRQPPGRNPGPHRVGVGNERIELVTGGKGAIALADGTWADVSVGSIAWQAAGDLTIARSDFNDPYRCLAVSVAVTPGAVRPVPRLTRWEDVDEVRAFVRTALRLAADPAADREWLLAFVYGRLLLAAQGAGNSSAGVIPEPLQRVLAVLEKRLADGIGIDELAATAGWSVSHLHAAFRRHLGVSPHQWLLRRRLHAARQQLAATDVPIAAVAAACGFADAAAFCRVFRRGEGTSPAAWRRSARGGG